MQGVVETNNFNKKIRLRLCLKYKVSEEELQAQKCLASNEDNFEVKTKRNA